MRNIKLVVAYDGKNYLGWQKTPMGPSIESILQSTLEQILQHPVPLQAASRTDAGVHAYGQVVNFFTFKSIELARIQVCLNGLLPKDISVLDAQLMHPTFHPTIDCVSKEYVYYVCFGRSQFPHHRFYSWHYPCPSLQIGEMKRAADYFIGEHDFSALCNHKKNMTYKDYLRTVEEIRIEAIDHQRLSISVRGSHFLYKMVRNIVGTLLYVGKGKIRMDELKDILTVGKRKDAGVTAPAHGLFLSNVRF